MFENRTITRPMFGEIWMCELGVKEGSVQGGYRPVLILSNDKNNSFAPTVNVIPITSKIHKKLPVHVPIVNFEQCGLSSPSVLLVEQITTINANALDYKLGKVSDSAVFKRLNQAIAIQFPIPIGA